MKPSLLSVTPSEVNGGISALADAVRGRSRERVRLGVRRQPEDAAQPNRLIVFAVAAFFLLGAAWLALQLHYTKGALDAAGLRLALAETRHAQAEQRSREAATLVQRFRDQLADVRTEAAAVLDSLRSNTGAAPESAALAVRTGQSGPAMGNGIAPTQPGFPQLFSAAREAVLYIRTTYRLALVQTGQEEELTAYGTGFLIDPSGVALTAQHVIYPWRYDRRLQASLAMGLVRVVDGSQRVTAWLPDSRAQTPAGEDAPFEVGRVYHGDGQDGAIRILHIAQPDIDTDVVFSTAGPIQVQIPRPGQGDVVALQLVDAARRFPFLPLGAAPPERHPLPLDEVLVVGYPLSRLEDGWTVPQPTAGRVRRSGGRVLELDTSLHPGNSGGPILDRSGMVIGMASAILDSPVYGLAVHAEELHAAWQAVQATTAQEQARLKALGCDPGPIDGLPGPRTLAARDCAARRASGI